MFSPFLMFLSFYCIIFYGLDINKEQKLHNLENVSELGLSFWIRHNTGVKLTCISVGKNGLGERMTWVVPLWMTFSLVPFIKLYFLTDFS